MRRPLLSRGFTATRAQSPLRQLLSYNRSDSRFPTKKTMRNDHLSARLMSPDPRGGVFRTPLSTPTKQPDHLTVNAKRAWFDKKLTDNSLSDVCAAQMDIPSISLTSGSLFAAGLFILWLALIAIRRRFSHPLATIPGPFLAAVTSLYGFYYNAIKGGVLYLQIEHLHEIYGTTYALNHRFHWAYLLREIRRTPRQNWTERNPPQRPWQL